MTCWRKKTARRRHQYKFAPLRRRAFERGVEFGILWHQLKHAETMPYRAVIHADFQEAARRAGRCRASVMTVLGPHSCGTRDHPAGERWVDVVFTDAC